MKKSKTEFQLNAATIPVTRSYNYQAEINVRTTDHPIIQTVNGLKYEITRIVVDLRLIGKNSTK